MNANTVASQTNAQVREAQMAPVTKEVFDKMRLLSEERAQWENTELKTANEHLYEILAKCYSGELKISKMTNGQKAAIKGLSLFALQTMNHRFKDSTPLMNRIVQCVFGNVNRSRVSSYSLALRAAKQRGITPENLAAFITNAGGIQEVTMEKSANHVTTADKKEWARTSIEKKSLVAINADLLGQRITEESVGKQCVMIATQNADGTLSINAVVHSETAVTAALVSFYGLSDNERAEEKKRAARLATSNGTISTEILIEPANTLLDSHLTKHAA